MWERSNFPLKYLNLILRPKTLKSSIWKHTTMCAKDVFSSINISNLRRPIEFKFLQVCYFVYTLRYTKWEDWSLTITKGVQCLKLVQVCYFMDILCHKNSLTFSKFWLHAFKERYIAVEFLNFLEIFILCACHLQIIVYLNELQYDCYLEEFFILFLYNYHKSTDILRQTFL